MGWYGTTGATKSDVIAELIHTQEYEGQRRETLQHTVRGGVLWTVEQVTHADGSTQRFIGCYLLQTHKDGASYKPMDESMGPYYYSCPLSYLDAVPVANANWRANVHEYHARASRVRKLNIGDRVELDAIAPTEATITSLKPLLGRAPSGDIYRIPKRLIK